MVESFKEPSVDITNSDIIEYLESLVEQGEQWADLGTNRAITNPEMETDMKLMVSYELARTHTQLRLQTAPAEARAILAPAEATQNSKAVSLSAEAFMSSGITSDPKSSTSTRELQPKAPLKRHQQIRKIRKSIVETRSSTTSAGDWRSRSPPQVYQRRSRFTSGEQSVSTLAAELGQTRPSIKVYQRRKGTSSEETPSTSLAGELRSPSTPLKVNTRRSKSPAVPTVVKLETRETDLRNATLSQPSESSGLRRSKRIRKPKNC
ncbi:unnamed protein product [Calypogeia fissa]